MLTKLNENTLRSYYSKSFGLIGRFAIPDDAFETDDFQTYLALKRIQFPEISAFHAAKSSGRASFEKLIDKFDVADSVDSELPGFFMLSRKKNCDLSSANIPPDVISLTIDRCKNVSGLGALSLLRNLRNLSCVYSDSHEPELFPQPAIIDSLEINSCNTTCVETLLSGIHPQTLEIYHVSDAIFSCKMLEDQARISNLRIEAPFVRDICTLSKLPIKKLFLNRVAMDADIADLLNARINSLQELGIVSTTPFLPDVLKIIPSNLRRLTVPAFEKYREQWIEWAIMHREIACVFSAGDTFEFPGKVPKVSVAEIYHGITILELSSAGKTRYEISEDIATIAGLDLSNGDIEDRIRPVAQSENKKIEWSSEADMFVADCVDLCTCRWLVDTVLSLYPEKRNQK